LGLLWDYFGNKREYFGSNLEKRGLGVIWDRKGGSENKLKIIL